MRLFADANYDFLGQRKRAYVLSSIVIGSGLVAMVINFATLGSWLNYGVDFTGGTLVEVEFQQPTQANDIRAALGDAEEASVSQFGDANVFLVRLPLQEGLGVDEVSRNVQDELTAAYGAGAFEVQRTELVSPIVGEELQQKAVLATLLSFLLTLIYLGFRFEFRFGLAAVIATIHDILLTLSFIAIFRIEMMLPTIAAILTIVGYSLNDTIVVFDRIRENLHARGAKKADQYALINRSLNETLPRTVMTGLSVLATLVALLVFGPRVLRDFSAVMLIGIIAGTYSSLWVASPALVEIRHRFGEGTPNQPRKRAETATV